MSTVYDNDSLYLAIQEFEKNKTRNKKTYKKVYIYERDPKYSKQYYNENKEYILNRTREYYFNNRDKIRAYQKRYYLKNKK